MSNSLYHHGIKGMKWGVRRTPEQLERARGYVGESKKIVDGGKNINQSIANIRATKNRATDLSQMSDQELRDRVNRMNLERQYSSLAAEDKLRGQAYVRDTLDIAGNVLAITSSALAIAIAIKKLKE